jgi:hypothetical protein
MGNLPVSHGGYVVGVEVEEVEGRKLCGCGGGCCRAGINYLSDVSGVIQAPGGIGHVGAKNIWAGVVYV